MFFDVFLCFLLYCSLIKHSYLILSSYLLKQKIIDMSFLRESYNKSKFKLNKYDNIDKLMRCYQIIFL
jgi:hypothetical protein